MFEPFFLSLPAFLTPKLHTKYRLEYIDYARILFNMQQYVDSITQ